MALDPINKFMPRKALNHMLFSRACGIADMKSMQSMISQTLFGEGRIDTIGIGFLAGLKNIFWITESSVINRDGYNHNGTLHKF